MYYECQYINAETNWEPSCSPNSPYDPNATPQTCDCIALDAKVSYICHSTYEATDNYGEPSSISCPSLSFLQAFYYMIVTVATVGYGDITPTFDASRAVVVIFICVAVVLIPMQINELTVLLAASSAYRQPYKNTNGESHIVICGYISDFRKLEKFFKEFFHPDRNYSAAPDFHAVILSPMEPSSDIMAMMYSSHFDGRITYIIGSSLSTEDLQKAKADTASAMFFFCNVETPEENAKLDDAATVLRTLSVTNFNSHLECFVQVLKPEDRDILKDSEVDVILCLDEYKTCMQARNAVCPGISTLVENLFHTFALPNQFEKQLQEERGFHQKWADEYSYGVSMEPYFIPLMPRYCEMLSYEWSLIVEGLLLEFDVHCIGVASATDHSLILNPGPREMRRFQYNSRFFKKYNMAIILCNEQNKAASIGMALEDPQVIDRILNKILLAEESFTVRRHLEKRMDNRKVKNEDKLILTQLRDIIRVSKSWTGTKVSQANMDADSDEDDEFANLAAANAPKKSAKLAAKVSKLVPVKKHMHNLDGQKSMSKRRDETDTDSDDEEDSGKASLKNAPKVASALEKIRRQSSFQASSLTGLSRVNLGVPLGAQSDTRDGNHAGTMEPDAASSIQAGKEVSGTVGDALIDDGVVMNTLDNANHLSGHIIVFGCTTNVFLFLTELRREIHATGPGMMTPPAVIIVDLSPPSSWPYIMEAFTEVYFIRGKMTRSVDFNRTNIAKAKSVVLLAGRDHVTKVEEENLDAEALFAYLKLEKYIPRDVFFTVELTCVSNIAVLNSTVVRRFRTSQAAAHQARRLKEKEKLEEEMKKKMQQLADQESESSEDETPKAKKKRRKNRAKSGIEQEIFRPISEISKGTFSTHKAVMKTEYFEHVSRGILNVLSNVPARRISSLETSDLGRPGAVGKVSSKQRKLEAFWTSQDSHQMLSVFASGNAFVPAAFDALLAQSFFVAFTPLLAERLVCGSKYQSIFQMDVPMSFVDRFFVDIYRAFMSHGLLILALYRMPLPSEGATLPFVLTAPKADTIVRSGDRLFVICNPKILEESLPVLTQRLVEYPDGSVSLADTLGLQLGVPLQKQVSVEETKAAGPAEKGSGLTNDRSGYRYIQTLDQAAESGSHSPMKQQVSQVFFKNTSLPL